MKNIVLKLGLIAGITVSLFMILSVQITASEKFDFDLGQIVGYASMLAAFSTIFIGIKKYRDDHSGGVISFKKAMSVGVLISLIASACYVITWLVFSGGETAQVMMDQYFMEAIDEIKNSGLAAEEIQSRLEKMNNMKENYNNPLFKILITLMEILPVGIIVSFIASLILKRN